MNPFYSSTFYHKVHRLLILVSFDLPNCSLGHSDKTHVLSNTVLVLIRDGMVRRMFLLDSTEILQLQAHFRLYNRHWEDNTRYHRMPDLCGSKEDI